MDRIAAEGREDRSGRYRESLTFPGLHFSHVAQRRR